ncbi:MAG: GTP-binding protein, partial [Lachnospiraceae bacterium]|nr:GTP-binding protein [Lachnospiraceae bacterium]
DHDHDHEHHHDHDHDHDHDHHHDHDHDHEHEHHHDHDHDHHHEHDEHCTCGCHDHDHHHHHADEVFTSLGLETAATYTIEEVEAFLEKFDDSHEYGTVLRAKGMFPGEGQWIYFDYVPGESNVRTGAAQFTGKACVIGSDLNEEKIRALILK